MQTPVPIWRSTFIVSDPLASSQGFLALEVEIEWSGERKVLVIRNYMAIRLDKEFEAEHLMQILNAQQRYTVLEFDLASEHPFIERRIECDLRAAHCDDIRFDADAFRKIQGALEAFFSEYIRDILLLRSVYIGYDSDNQSKH